MGGGERRELRRREGERSRKRGGKQKREKGEGGWRRVVGSRCCKFKGAMTKTESTHQLYNFKTPART